MDRRTFLARAGALATPLVAGCLDDDGGQGETEDPTQDDEETTVGDGSSSVTASPTIATGSTSAQEEFPDYNWEALEGVEAEHTREITLRNTAFHPTVAAVPPGATVTFTNNDSFGHTVTIPAMDVDRDLAGGASTTVTAVSVGTYDYVCTKHPPGMLGRLVVTDETPTPTPTGTPTPTAAETTTETGTETATTTPTETGTPTPTATEDDGGYY